MFTTRDDMNPFTEEVKKRCLRDGSCLVRLRDNSWRDVKYKGEDEEDGISEGFQADNWGYCWYMDGKSFNTQDWDMVEIND